MRCVIGGILVGAIMGFLFSTFVAFSGGIIWVSYQNTEKLITWSIGGAIIGAIVGVIIGTFYL